MILATVPVVILDLTSLESITSKITLAARPTPVVILNQPAGETTKTVSSDPIGRPRFAEEFLTHEMPERLEAVTGNDWFDLAVLGAKRANLTVEQIAFAGEPDRQIARRYLFRNACPRPSSPEPGRSG